ncbi:hypothetical protein [Hymenobacter antarcticus]|uniref:Uncharacterized protein n=1 Tax=Hymenobacter antarcticus TaxID=486270 RepID=A0ABP7QKK4_9BACT
MKTLIFLLLLKASTINAQTLTLNQLKKVYNSTEEESDIYLSERGWEVYSNETKDDATFLTWAYKPNSTVGQSAKGWLTVVHDEDGKMIQYGPIGLPQFNELRKIAILNKLKKKSEKYSQESITVKYIYENLILTFVTSLRNDVQNGRNSYLVGLSSKW